MRNETLWTFAAIERLVLFEDNHLLAMEKPSGMLTQADRTGDICLMDLAKQYLKEKYHKPGEVFLGLVHRLEEHQDVGADLLEALAGVARVHVRRGLARVDASAGGSGPGFR